MASATRDMTLDRVFGVPQEDNTTHISFTSSGVDTNLTSNEVYRMVPTEDCYISISDGTDMVTASGVYLVAFNEYYFQTNTTNNTLSTVRVSTNGTLVTTKMIPGKNR